MAEAAMETKFLVVVGMTRPKLNKIMTLVKEQQSAAEAELNSVDSATTSLSVELVPCLATLSSYMDENGGSVRYLSNVIYHDSTSMSPTSMTAYFDDPNFRENLDSVLLVGYEWLANDDEKIQVYFKAMTQLETVSVQCVKPKPGFDNLQEEMDALRQLDEETKQHCLGEGSMGPAKMAKAIIDSIHQIKKKKADMLLREKEKAAQAATSAAAMTNEVSLEQQPSQPQPPEPADPSRPRYACRMCRTILFGENHLAQDHIQNRHSFKKLNQTPAASCQSIFCSDDVLQWLSSPSGEDVEGKLTCPRCSHKIGHWKWAGAQCSCGTWVTPAIQIPASKVDVVACDSVASATTGLVGIVNPSSYLQISLEDS